MPSPFPGMDPYLEHPWLWPDVHAGLIIACQELLNRHLRPKYVARVEERVYVEAEDDPARKTFFVPDLRVAKQPRPAKATRKPAAPKIAESVVVTFEPELELRETRIEVQATDTRDVVAVIEILSPSNKLSGAEGRASFLAKRDEVMNSPAHWVEIDLLRAGEVPSYRRRLGPHEYAAFASVVERRPNGRAWPIRLGEPLPVIGIPLRKGDGEAPLDLQGALSAVYDRAALDMSVDYSAPPDPPLPNDLAKWANARLKKKRLR
jgi:hypothetical protein